VLSLVPKLALVDVTAFWYHFSERITQVITQPKRHPTIARRSSTGRISMPIIATLPLISGDPCCDG
jgi:hypothetical protein